jgi:hypothetical protein
MVIVSSRVTLQLAVVGRSQLKHLKAFDEVGIERRIAIVMIKMKNCRVRVTVDGKEE